jgi:predicted esterase
MRRCGFGVGLGALMAVGCGSKPGQPTGPVAVVVTEQAPSELPDPPTGLKEPPAPPAEVNGKALGKLPVGELMTIANQAAARKDFKTAAAAEYWAIKAGGGDLYDLARYFSGAKDADAGLYWLAQAAHKRGVDPAKVTTHSELKTVWDDPRYQDTVFPYIAHCSQYFAAHGSGQVVTIIPDNFDKTMPTPVIVFLHGRDSQPAEALGPETANLAKSTGLPVIAVSGSVPLGPTRYSWAGEAEKDGKRIAEALKGQSEKVTVSPGKVILVGFDEGAQVALELAVRDPARFAGAIAISPSAEFKLGDVPPPPRTSRFVVVMGTRETWNRDTVKKDRDFLAAAGVPLLNVDIPNGEHKLPADLAAQLPKWVAFVTERK